MAAFKFTEDHPQEYEGLSSAVWKELVKEVQRRQIYERAAVRRDHEQQKEQLCQQMEIMKLLHPLDFAASTAGCGTSVDEPGSSAAILGAGRSAPDAALHPDYRFRRDYEQSGGTREGCDVTADGHSTARSYRRGSSCTDQFAGGDHYRNDAGMNWDASGRLRGSPGLSVPNNGHDEWMLSGGITSPGGVPHLMSRHNKDRDDTELESETYQTSSMRRRPFPTEALAAMRVDPPEVQWPQSDAVRHILEEEDEQDAALFALQKAMEGKDLTAGEPTGSKTMAATADNASSTRWQQDPCDSDHIDVIYKKIAAAAKPISSANDFRRHMYSTTDILKSKEGGVGRMMGKPTDALQELRSGMVSRAGRAEPRTERRKVSFAEDASSPARKLSEVNVESRQKSAKATSSPALLVSNAKLKRDDVLREEICKQDLDSREESRTMTKPREKKKSKKLAVASRVVEHIASKAGDQKNDCSYSESKRGACGKDKKSKESKRRRRQLANETRMLCRIERAVDVGLHLRRLSRLNNIEEDLGI